VSDAAPEEMLQNFEDFEDRSSAMAARRDFDFRWTGTKTHA
jgi:hypothetical protein